MTRVLITGAAGNLDSLLSRHILDNESDLDVILMQHRKQVSSDIRRHPNVSVRNADLSKPHSIHECLDDADMIVHLAGVLFKANPEKFLFDSNIQYLHSMFKCNTRP